MHKPKPTIISDKKVDFVVLLTVQFLHFNLHFFSHRSQQKLFPRIAPAHQIARPFGGRGRGKSFLYHRIYEATRVLDMIRIPSVDTKIQQSQAYGMFGLQLESPRARRRTLPRTVGDDVRKIASGWGNCKRLAGNARLIQSCVN